MESDLTKTDSQTIEIPPEIPGYELERRIARGGYGDVWLARHCGSETWRAVKVIHRAKFDTDRPYEREFEGIQKFEPLSRTHASLIQIVEKVGRNDAAGYFYYVMELADDQNQGSRLDPATYKAKTLDSEIRGRRSLPVEECLQLGLSLCDALQHLHQHGLVHRDVKPSNIIYVGGRLKLADIGLVSAAGNSSFVGTPGYFPPELPGAPTGDVYGLGKVLYQCLTGKDAAECPNPPTNLAEFGDQAGMLEFNEIVLRSTEPDLNKRYRSVNVLRGDLLWLQSGKSILEARRTERHLCVLRKVTAAAAMLAVVSFAVTWFMMRQAKAEAKHRQLSEQAHAQTAAMLTRLELNHAEDLFENGHPAAGVAYLARVLRQYPANQVVATRLVSALTQRNFPLTLIEPLRHADGVISARFSPDGQRILTAAHDKTVRVWSSRDGRPLTPPLLHADAVCAQFSPDGNRILTASWDGTARIFNSATGESLRFFLSHASGIYWAQYSNDGEKIVTASSDHTARIWDARSGKELTPPLRHGDQVRYAEFSRDGQCVLTASHDGTARVWDATTGLARTPPMEHKRMLESARFSPNNLQVVTASWDFTARVWDAGTGRAISEPLRHEAVVLAVEFSPDGQYLATASQDKTAMIWDWRTGKRIASLRHQARVECVRYSLDGRRLVTTSHDYTARVWDAATGQPLGEPLRHNGTVWRAEFDGAGEHVLTACRDGAARLWTLLQPATGTLLSHPVKVTAVEFSPEGHRLATIAADNAVRLWDLRTERLLSQPMRHLGAVRTVKFSPNGRLLATGSQDHTAQVWEADSGRPLTATFQHHGPVSFATFDSASKRLLTVSRNAARLWAIDTGNCLATFNHPAPVSWAELSSDGRHVATAAHDHSAIIWDAATGQKLTPPMTHGDTVHCVRFSSDGRRVVTASADGTARMWDTRTGQPLTHPFTHGDRVKYAQFTLDDRRIGTITGLKSAALWDTQTGRLLASPLQSGADVVTKQFSLDAERVLIGSTNGTVRVLDAVTGYSLVEPMRLGEIVWHARFSDDGRRVAVAFGNKDVRIWELPETGLAPPPWLSDFAEAVGGQRLNAGGSLESVSSKDFAGFWQRSGRKSAFDLYGELLGRFSRHVPGTGTHAVPRKSQEY